MSNGGRPRALSDEQVAEATELRAAGVRYQSIADHFGVALSCVWKSLHRDQARTFDKTQNQRPERNAAKREWDRVHRPPCPRCGKPKSRKWSLCRPCQKKERAANTHKRRGRIAALWASGVSVQSIAQTLDSTPNSINTELARMRTDGWDLPRRRPGWKTRTQRAAEPR